MYVILNKDIKGIGKKLQTVEVSDGYARNYLLPKKLAVRANSKNLSESNSKRNAIDFKEQTKKEEAEKMKIEIEKQKLTFNMKVGKDSKLFGSITAKEICEEINKRLNFNLDKKRVEVVEQIKSPGIYNAKVKLYEGITAIQKVEVIGK